MELHKQWFVRKARQMKKVLFGILLVAMMVSFCGCDDTRPSKWDFTDVKRWEIRASGKLVSISKISHPSCSKDKGYCSNHPQLDNYVFEDGREVALHQIKDPGIVSPGQTGNLHKYIYGGSKDCYAWFQWVQDKTIPVSVAQKPISIPAFTKPTALNINIVDKDKTIWIDNSEQNPKRYTPVLIKFKNDALSIGYINNINEWKLSINRRQEGGGETIAKTEIIFWKSVDID
jgi:hypothetical protein